MEANNTEIYNGFMQQNEIGSSMATCSRFRTFSCNNSLDNACACIAERCSANGISIFSGNTERLKLILQYV